MRDFIKRLYKKSFITVQFYNKNILFESAASCSFGFVFSFIPLIMIVVGLLGGILRHFPETYDFVVNITSEFRNIYDINSFIEQLSKTQSWNAVDIIMAFWIIWMARRFFLSIAQGMTTVFHKVAKPIPFIMQVFAFVGEMVLVVVIMLLVLISFMMNQLLTLPIFDFLPRLFPLLFKAYTKFLPTLFFYLVIFICTTLVYRYESRTKPKLSLCMMCSFLVCISFFVFSIFINLFLDFSRYNLIYGTISTLIILMMKVYTFFVLFLFFAQWIYVSQFIPISLKKESQELSS